MASRIVESSEGVPDHTTGMPKSKQSPWGHPPETAFIIVGGRRWRTSDPNIPGAFRQELVNELMAARRAVRDAKSQLEIRRSRRRVHDAKLALGERGHAWWLAAETGRNQATHRSRCAGVAQEPPAGSLNLPE